MMNEFESATKHFSSFLKQLSILNCKKQEFARKINHQVIKLYSVIEVDPILLRRRYAQQGFTPISLCAFLNINKNNLRRDYSIYSIEESDIETFKKLIQFESQMERSLVEFLRSLPFLQKIFLEIDFFGNGYIDEHSFYEFLTHYHQTSEGLDQENCRNLLLFLRNDANRKDEHIFIEDLKAFRSLEAVASKELNDCQVHLSEKQLVLFTSSEEIASPPMPRRLLNPSSNNQMDFIKQMPHISLKTMINPLKFQERLIRSHKRNQKYLVEIKLQLQPHLAQPPISVVKQVPTSGLHYTQIMLKVQIIAEMIEQNSTKIKAFIEENPRFTFLNGFNVLDANSVGYVALDDFYDFILECNIPIPHRKLQYFFQSHAKTHMVYSDYLKIFKKYMAIGRQYEDCRKRSPLICENWPKNTQEDYCDLLKELINSDVSIMKIVNEIDRVKFNEIFKDVKQKEDVEELIGDNFPCLIGILCEKGFVKVDRLWEAFRINRRE